MPEKWKEIYTEEELKKIQTIEIESLRVFSDVCSKIGLKYFLYGGSLLGAVKYNGFVPWDDDLDIGLMRCDYEKLIKLGPALLPPNYELQHPKINKLTPYPYIKFRRTDTTMVEYSSHKIPINHGVYFDIYPIDNIPEDDEEYIKAHNKSQFLVRLFLLRQKKSLSRPATSPSLAVKAFIKSLLYYALHLIPHDYLFSKIDSNMTKYNSSCTRRQGNYFYPRPVNYFNGIEPLIEIKFEGLDMYIPKGYEINLKNRYGDITELPPEENRFGHRPYSLDLGK